MLEGRDYTTALNGYSLFFPFQVCQVSYYPHTLVYFLDLAMATGGGDPRSMTVSRNIIFSRKLLYGLWT